MSNGTIKVIKRGSDVKIISSAAISVNTEKIKQDFDRNTVKAVKIWIDERRENQLIEGVNSRSGLSAWSSDQIEPDKPI